METTEDSIFDTVSVADESVESSDNISKDDETPLSSAPISTHDTSRAKYHMRDLGTFANNLENSARRLFPNRNAVLPRYERVEVLLLRWENDEMGVEFELDDLGKVFESYGFNKETWLIPSENPHLELTIKAANFVKDHESEECLIIMYYGGHASINAARQSTWSCTRDSKSPSLDWSAIQKLFEKSISDVLLLLDCCAAASAAPMNGRAMTETIAACGWESVAPLPGRWSFTNTLIEVLEDCLDQPLSAAMLHNKVLSTLKHEQPERSLKRGDRKRFECRRTPVYIVATTDPRLPSIDLSRISPSPSAPNNGKKEDFSYPKPSGLRERSYFDIVSDSKSFDQQIGELTSTSPDGELNSPHVLISLALEEDQYLDLKACTDWLGRFPALAKYARVQGVYKSFSTLLIASIPVAIWDLLPDDAACSFVGYVSSENLLKRTESFQGREKVESSHGVEVHTIVELDESEDIAKEKEGSAQEDSGEQNQRVLSPQAVRPAYKRASSTVSEVEIEVVAHDVTTPG